MENSMQDGLMRESLWRIVTGEETAPTRGSESEQAKFASRRDRALATIVLTVDTSLLYLIGNPENPVEIWKKLTDQFEKKTWATRLDLRRKLHSLRLKDGESAQTHIKAMVELFDALSVAGETIKEEDRVVYLLASLPESYNVLVTALEANEDVPKLEVLTERILHQERKFNNRSEASSTKESAYDLACSFRGRACFHCGKPGHIRKNCYDFKAEKRRKEKRENPTASQKAAASVAREDSHSDSEESVLISIDDRALYTTSSHEQSTWIVDSGATTHMCHDKQSFTNLYQLENPIDVVLGDGRALTAVGRGEVVLDMVLPNGESKLCTLCDVLYVPQLSHNLISVTKATQTGKVVKFTKSACYLLSKKHQMVAKATQSREPLSA